MLFLEKVSAAIEHVDSSSGSIGTAVNNAIVTLVPVIADVPASDDLREEWMNRLWQAVEEDNMPYLELLPEYWGGLCVTRELVENSTPNGLFAAGFLRQLLDQKPTLT